MKLSNYSMPSEDKIRGNVDGHKWQKEYMSNIVLKKRAKSSLLHSSGKYMLFILWCCPHELHISGDQYVKKWDYYVQFPADAW